MLADSTDAVTAIRGAALTFTGDPFLEDPASCVRYESDAIVVMADGHVVDFGPAAQVAGRLRAETRVTRYTDALRVQRPKVSVLARSLILRLRTLGHDPGVMEIRS